MNNKQWEDANERGRNLGKEMAPDIVKIVEETIDQWIEEHTTLTGARKSLWRTATRQAALRSLAATLRLHGEGFFSDE